jgi:hypothetical protein
MKKETSKIVCTLMLAFLGFGTYAQTDETSAVIEDKTEKTGPADGYRRWTLDANIGFNKAFGPYASGYGGPQLIGLFHGDIGVRYMPNPYFGVKALFGHETFSNSRSGAEYSTNYERLSFLGMVNLGRICSFEDWTKTIGLFMHLGPGGSFMTGTRANGVRGRDLMVHLQLGFTPTFKINEKVAINADLTVVGNLLQGNTFDFQGASSISGFGGYFMTMSAGVAINIGGGDKNMDWKERESGMAGLVDSLAMELANLKYQVDNTDRDVQGIENNMKDDDNDGVANYLDTEANTPEEAMVNTKGEEIVMPKMNDLMENTDKTKNESMFYTVQLGVFSKMIPEKYWRSIAPIYSLKIEDGTSRYFSGIFHSTEEAFKKLDEARAKGMGDAFVTAYYKGKRITVTEADILRAAQGPSILRKKP